MALDDKTKRTEVANMLNGVGMEPEAQHALAGTPSQELIHAIQGCLDNQIGSYAQREAARQLHIDCTGEDYIKSPMFQANIMRSK